MFHRQCAFGSSRRPLEKPKSSSFESIFLFALLGLLVASSALSSASTPHVVRLANGVESFSLPLSGWLVDAGVQYAATVVSPPQRGSWQNEVYVPNPEFWEAGGDTFSLAIQENGMMRSALETVVLIAAPGHEMLWEREDFESSGGSLSGIDPEWQLDGSLQQISIVPNAVDGNWALQVMTDEPLESGLQKVSWVVDGRPGGTDQVGMEAEINPDPPDSPITLGLAAEMALVTLANRYESADWVQIRLRYDGGAVFLQAVLDPLVWNCGASCATPWRAIPLSSASRFSLWMGYEGFGHPAFSSPILRFKIESSTGGSLSEDVLELSGMPTLRRFRFGAFDLDSDPDPGPLFLQMDNLTVQAGVVSYRDPFAFLTDEFSPGFVRSEWIVDGPVQTEPSGTLDGYQMVVDSQDLTRTVPHATLLDLSPSQADTLTARFLADLRDLNLSNGEGMEIFSAGSTNSYDPSHGRLFSIQLTSQQNQLQLRARTTDNQGLVHHTPWIQVDQKRIPITLRWQATNGDEFGKMVLWAEDQRAVKLGIENTDQRVESVCFGVQNWSFSRVRNKFSSGSSSVKKIGFDHLVSFE